MFTVTQCDPRRAGPGVFYSLGVLMVLRCWAVTVAVHDVAELPARVPSVVVNPAVVASGCAWG
jgi:hypothetical protein